MLNIAANTRLLNWIGGGFVIEPGTVYNYELYVQTEGYFESIIH